MSDSVWRESVGLHDTFVCLQSPSALVRKAGREKPKYSSLRCGANGQRVNQDAQQGMHITLLEDLCDAVVSGRLASAHCTREAPRDATCKDERQPGGRLQDVRNLVGLLAGYMLMNSTCLPGAKRRVSTLCVSEVQCIVQDALSRQDDTDFAPATIKLQKWASS